jgi:VIT1/CCC1 family predicted Fe2+/Mn2+ transporter
MCESKELKKIFKLLLSIFTMLGALVLLLPFLICFCVFASVALAVCVSVNGWENTMIAWSVFRTSHSADLENHPLNKYFKLLVYEPKL